MDKIFEQWVDEIRRHGLRPQDLDRTAAYAKDLISGLAFMRTYQQGVVVFGSARIKEKHKYYKKARLLGQMLAKNHETVITGGGPSIMEAANRGAFEAGGRSIGLNIELEHEQHPNPYLTDTMTFRYFFARKVMLAMSGKVYVIFPGGYGTMDELTEILTLMRDGKMPKMPIFLYGKSFWRPLDRFFLRKLYGHKLIAAKDLNLYTITDDLDLIVKTASKIKVPNNTNLYDGFTKF